MKVTISVPEIPWADMGDEPECTMCHEPITNETSVRLPGIRGHICASNERPCLRQALKYIEDQGTASAWLLIAEAVARAPHRHTAATIRATIQNLAILASMKDGPR